MKKYGRQAVNLFLALTILGCATAPVRNSQDIPELVAKASAGNKSALATLLVTLDPQKAQPPSLVEATLQQMGPLMAQKEVREAVKHYLSSPAENLRSAAFTIWPKARPVADPVAFDQELTAQLFANQNRFGRLTEAEYLAAIYSEDPQSVEFLRRNLGKYPEADPIILHSLAEMTARQKPSESPNTTPEVTDNQTPSKDNKAKLPEESIMEYLASQREPSLVNLAIQKLETSWGATGYDQLLAKVTDRYLPLTTRLNILNYLAETEQDRAEKKLAKTLTTAWVWFHHEAEYQNKINEILITLTGKPVKVEKKVKRKSQPMVKSILSAEMRQKIIQQDPRGRLVSLFKAYQLQEPLVAQMEQHASLLVNKSNGIKLDPATKLLFYGLSQAKPQANFFELKKLAQQGFTTRGYYREVMKAIVNSPYHYEWQIVAIRRVWGVKEEVAEVLHKMYLAEHKLF